MQGRLKRNGRFLPVAAATTQLSRRSPTATLSWVFMLKFRFMVNVKDLAYVSF